MCLDATPGGNWGNRAFADIINNREQFPVPYELLKATFFRPKEELYDLNNDLYEMKNLAALPEYTTTVVKLSSVLDDWMKRTCRGITLKGGGTKRNENSVRSGDLPA